MIVEIKLNSDLKAVGPDRIEFKSNDDLRRGMRPLFLSLLAIVIFANILSSIRAENFFRELLLGSFQGSSLFFVFILAILLIGWVCAPKREIYLDRSTFSVKYRSNRIVYEFPWNQVVPTNKWELGKTGTLEWLQLHVVPPLPDALAREFEKKGRTPDGTYRGAILGTISTTGADHGMAIYRFLDAWMKSKEHAWPLYQTMVLIPYGI